MKICRFASALVLSATIGLACLTVSAGEPATADPPLVSEAIREAMQDRQYAKAVEAIDAALDAKGADAKDSPHDYLLYLKGRALSLDQKQDAAIATFDRLVKEYPTSPWIRRARFAKAVALARKGDSRGAELIYRAEAEYLLSPDRKQQIADIYLDFADVLFKPPKEEQKPDFAKALEFYKKALEVGPKADRRTEVELLVAQCHQGLSQYAEAAALYERFSKDYPGSPLDIDARFRLGQCRLAEGNAKEARRAWQDLLAKYVDSQSPRVAEAQFNLALTWNIPNPASDEDLNLGTGALAAFLERFPKHKLSGEAFLLMADSFLNRGRYEDAVATLKRFLADPRCKECRELPDGHQRLGRAYQLQKRYAEALATWREFLAAYPTHAAWSEVQRQIIETEYLAALDRVEAKQYEAANKLLADFLAKYPLDPRNPGILLQMNRQNIAEEKWDDAIAQWRRLVSKYPDTDEASQAQLSIADTLERKLGRLEEALEEYRHVTHGSALGEARHAIARLTARTMTVATDRVFRSDETPRLTLVTRNIESVTVRVFKVDLETYFRKMHVARGVEGLDIALIDPDRTFEFKVPKYAKHQELESAVEVPLPAGLTAGAAAVTVSSKTLEATTLLIRSDLDVIVKSSRDEVFVFAENMLTGKPWPGARLLVSNGREVIGEGVAGPDGVFRKSYKELASARSAAQPSAAGNNALETNDVRVFAAAAGHVASNVVDLQGVGVVRGLTDRGYIYTDRPAYRAGQMVNVRGCLRHAVDDAYTVERGKSYTVEVFDGRNRLVRQEQVKLGEFGAFQTHFELPAGSPQGQYRVLVHDAAGQNYQGTFLVHQYQIEPIRIVVDTPRHVYYRGESIEGTLRAEFYYGAPVAGREIRYRLADDRQQTATTDAKGEVHFKLPTREYSESQTLALVVQMPENNIAVAVSFVLAAEGFSVDVSTVRPVYVAGETFEATVAAKDAEGKPISQKLKLKVLERTTVEGRVGERLVEEYPLETAADGKARQTLQLKRGGQFVLRAEGIDRFHNPISGQELVQISGEEDSVRLRILADRHTFKVGDTATVQLYWREDPALALIAFQGARVLDYRLVELRPGANRLDIPISASLAPNFELAVAVMTDPRPELKPAGEPPALGGTCLTTGGTSLSGAKGVVGGSSTPFVPQGVPPNLQATKAAPPRPIVRFHAASSPFTVERDLRVKIATVPKGEAGKIRPGDEVEVTVTTTDPQGRPVAAEVSLAMVETALLERFPPPPASIADFFRGEPREPAIRTTASVTFAYHPTTQPINPRLLAEQDRLEVAREEEESRRLAVAGTEVEAVNAPGTAVFGLIAPRGEVAADADRPVALSLSNRSMADLSRPEPLVGNVLARAHSRRAADGKERLAYRERAKGQSAAWAFAESGKAVDELSLAAGEKSDVKLGFAFAGVAITGGDLGRMVAQNQEQVLVVDRSGLLRSVRLGDDKGGWNAHRAETLAAELNQSGAIMLSAMTPQETGYWNPAIATGKDGRATVTFTVPERSTAWRLLAKGLTADTLCGESTDDLAVKKDLFGELKLPLAFTDGDEAEIPVTVHNEAVDKGRIEIVLKTTIAGRSVEERKTIDVTQKGLHETSFKTSLGRPAGAGAASEIDATFELTIRSGPRQDVVRRAVPLRPYGMPVFASTSGSASSDTTVWVESPKDMAVESPGLQILIGPTVERSLLDIVLGPAPWCQIEMGRIASGLESGTSDLMASLALQKLIGGSRDAGGPEAQALDGRVRASISLLLASQNDDGGWSWTGASGAASNRYASCQIVWAMATARAAGYPVPDGTMAKALSYLHGQAAATDNADYETKAILLHSLAVAGQGDFALANRLYRDRPMLSPAAMAHLALAFTAMDRKATAEELLALLADRNLDDAATRRESAKGSLPWSHASVELRALYALALQAVSPKSPKAKELVDWLLAHRTGNRWAPDKATGPAAMALARWFAQSRFTGEHYTLTVFVNDVQVKVLDVDQTVASIWVDVPSKRLVKGRQRIQFQLTGRGRYTYQCILGGFVPADQLRSTTAAWRVHRTYEPAPLEMDGREIPRGFGVLEGGYTTFRNPLEQLPVGRRGLVDLEIWRHQSTWDTPEERLEYLVVTEPIPSGTSVIEKSVRGSFERFEIGPGAITFYVGNRRQVGGIHYELYGYLPGRYRVGPTVVQDAHRPDQFLVAEPKSLAVLPEGVASGDAYRLTPQELYELGKRCFAKREFKTAMGHLAELLQKWNLRGDVYKDAVAMLLDIHLEIGPPAQVVHYFEIVKEKWPAEEIPFAKILKVGAAYHELGEYERSYLVFRATVESNFARESEVAGFLQGQGEFLRSVEAMGRLLREYPPEGYVAAAAYALAQQVAAKAPEAVADAKLRQQKVNRVDLLRRAWTMFEGFLTASCDDPAADQAAFAAASTLLDLKAYREAAAAANRYATRYAQSELVDSYWYIIGYCEFAVGRHKAALDMCRKVAELKRIDKTTGREVESANKWRAIYILGQVHHGLGEAADAIREYRRVEDRFADAKEAIAYFLRKGIELPEVTAVKPGEPARVEMKFRNIAACDVKVYRIDLMKFSLLRRNLGGIAQINLAGIRPLHEATIKLGDGADYRDRSQSVPLPLTEEGAYLVVCRGDDLHASGLVLVSPLAVEIQEDATSGRVRTTVKDVKADRYVGDVHVKVIGSRNDDFVAGSTDLRGVFVADGIRGRSTVIALAEPSRYAFFRGQTDLVLPAAQQMPQATAATPALAQPPSQERQLLEGLQEQNKSIQGQQIDNLKQMYNKRGNGVEAKAAF